MMVPQTADNCAGCAAQLIPVGCHATLCPAFSGHAAVWAGADFIECQCGIKSVNRVDRQSHINDVKRADPTPQISRRVVQRPAQRPAQ